ncbi:hypothetical protein BCR34DRAFT_583034 [Clohesyomyces aquaticus]|uniref:Zn(2)-C6 fungal-type domain-containing protein n=1 Tax=Clohesyomyces aquaticus TaxID=1231657 RepID=A0A1Y2A790_9PLEO|nr:hypothetical protein BCR34DRAFT_583034 [Clohesyomyces aquaticus]
MNSTTPTTDAREPQQFRPSQSPSVSDTTPLKLRESCEACATSKLRCSKEKPTCARCAKRNLSCKYVVTKRSNRKQEHRQNRTSAKLSGNSSTETEALGHSTPPNCTPPSGIETYHGPDSLVSPPEACPALPPGDPSILPFLNDTETEFHHCFLAPWPSVVTRRIDPESFRDSQSSSYFSHPEIGNNTSGINATFHQCIESTTDELPLLLNSGSLLQVFAPEGEGGQLSIHKSIPMPHSCLLRAIEMLAKHVQSNSTEPENSIPAMHSIINQNASLIIAFTEMFQCPCSQDGYLLAVMGLAALKMMSCYEMISSMCPIYDNDHCCSTAGASPDIYSTHHDLSTQDRDAVQGSQWRQIILSELHRVQGLVDTYSERVKASMDFGGFNTPSSSVSGNSSALTSGLGFPLSANMLIQLEADLRTRLRTISLEIVSRLG